MADKIVALSLPEQQALGSAQQAVEQLVGSVLEARGFNPTQVDGYRVSLVDGKPAVIVRLKDPPTEPVVPEPTPAPEPPTS